jgi:SPP1 gp7 family putative phage head morphogenesis protein
MPEFLFTAVPHNEAIDFIQSKPAVSRAVFDGLLPELRARAFTITGIESANVLQTVRDIVGDLPAGQTWDSLKSKIVDAISPYIIDPNATPQEQADQLAAAEAKAELLLRVHGQEAYAAAAYRVMDGQRQIFPYWQYQTMGDSHVRPTHRALDGLVLPAESPFWQTHFPPWDWGCRCIVIPLSRAGVEHIRQQDEKKPMEQRRVLEGPLLRELELNNRVVKGINDITNVQSPFQRGETGAFHWHPGELTIPLDELKARYDPQVWSKFENWARATEIPNENRTVWNWINDEPGAPEIASVTPPPAPKISLETTEAKIINDHTESAHLFNENGDLIFSREGTRNYVQFTPSDIARMKDLTLTHNHPRGNSFSGADVRLAFATDLAQIRAIGVTEDGRRFLYTLTRPESGWSANQLAEILDAYRAIDASLEAEWRAEIEAGRMTIAVAQSEHYNEVMRRVAAQFPEAIIYERTGV